MSGKRACIFGASGGIGRALVEALSADPDYDRIYAGARTAPLCRGPVKGFAFDLREGASIAAAAEQIAAEGPLDLVIVATGVLQRNSHFVPEKSWRALDGNAMAEVFALNTIGPALIGRAFLPLLRRDRRVIFAALSARVGSITDNRMGGWHSYRASKAALNMLIRNFAIELKQRNPQALAISLHPGTVDTQLSRPFQRGLAEGQLTSPAESASRLLSVLGALKPEDSGGFFAWDGQRLPF